MSKPKPIRKPKHSLICRDALRSARFFMVTSALVFALSLCAYAYAGIGFFPEAVYLSAEGVAFPETGPFACAFEPVAAVSGSGDVSYLDAAGGLSGQALVASVTGGDSYSTDMTLSFLGVPLKSVSVNVMTDVKVVPCGITAGIRIDATGLMVLGTGQVIGADSASSRPCEDLIKPGDILLKADDVEITSQKQLSSYVETLEPGGGVDITLLREGQSQVVRVNCAVSGEDGKNKLGLWIRESTQGIGTLTYYNPESYRFAALGHGVIDIDTKQLIPVRSGSLYEASIVTVKKGKKGSPGELVGEINKGSQLGVITTNSAVGLFGAINQGSAALPSQAMDVAFQTTVREGPAKMLSNVSGREVKEYDIYIERVNRFSADESKGMVIRITDQELITRTNGIVQGMSGCPIIQDGKLIGALTHVFVQNPLKGYGIFIENMLKQDR